MFAPVTDALGEDGAIGSGQVVLDVATGPGEPALSFAARVGSAGKVFGIDPAPEMVAAARRAVERLGLSNAQFDVAFADHLPFPADTFDAVVCRFGSMFFPSPIDGVREILRVLKPGRKLALAVWHSAERNPYFSTLLRVMDRYAPGAEPGAADAAFRFAGQGTLRDVLIAAGVEAPSERLLPFTIEAPISAEEFWNLRTEMSAQLRERVAKLPAEQLREAKREAIEALGAYSTDSGMSFPGEVRIVSGSK